MSNNYFGKGIPLASGFDLGAKAPLDSRLKVKTIAERDAHATNKRAYEGMRVFVIDEGKEYRYNGSEWEFMPSESDVQLMIAEAQFSGSDIDLSNLATKDELDEKANLSDIPTKVSDLENDLNYLVKEEGKSLLDDTEIERLATLENYDDTDLRNELNSKVDLSYVEQHFADKSFEHEHDNLVDLNSITSERIESWDNKSDFDGHYSSLIGAPSIPNKVSELSNDLSFVTEEVLNSKGYLTEHQDLSHLATKEELHTHSNYEVLNSITLEKLSEWDSKSDFDGSYTSLTNKPEIPSKVSNLENDLSFATESFVQNKIAEAQLNQGGEVDLSGLATKDELNAKMDKFDLSVYATQEYVEERINNHDHNIISNNEVDSFVDDLFL